MTQRELEEAWGQLDDLATKLGVYVYVTGCDSAMISLADVNDKVRIVDTGGIGNAWSEGPR